MNKKGSLFTIFLVVMFIALMVLALAVVTTKGDVKSKIIGSRQAKLFNLYKQGDDFQYYLDTAVAHTANAVLYEFETNGHYSDCGRVFDYYSWKTKDKECFPSKEKVSKAFAARFTEKLNPLLDNFQYELLESIGYEKLLNYSFPEYDSANTYLDLDEGKIVAEPIWSVKISEDPLYAVPASFSYYVDFDFNYQLIQDGMIKINDACKKKQDFKDKNNELLDCIANEMQSLNSEDKTWDLCEAEALGERTYAICIFHNRKLYSNNLPKSLSTKFAYYIDDEAAPPKVDPTVTGSTVSWQESFATDVDHYEVRFGSVGDKTVEVQALSYNLPSGTHKLSVVAVDVNGNKLEPSTQTVTVH